MACGVLWRAMQWHVSVATTPSSGDNAMLDLLFVVIILFGCVSSLAYVRGCERL
jgi:hypothetical protein